MAKSKTPTTGEVSRHPYRPLPPRGIIAIVRATRDKNVHRLPKQDPYSLPPRSAPGVAIHGRRAIKMSTACDPQPTVQAINQSNHINSNKINQCDQCDQSINQSYQPIVDLSIHQVDKSHQPIDHYDQPINSSIIDPSINQVDQSHQPIDQ